MMLSMMRFVLMVMASNFMIKKKMRDAREMRVKSERETG